MIMFPDLLSFFYPRHHASDVAVLYGAVCAVGVRDRPEC